VLLLSGGGGLLVRQLRHALSGSGGQFSSTTGSCEPADAFESAFTPPVPEMALVAVQTWYDDEPKHTHRPGRAPAPPPSHGHARAPAPPPSVAAHDPFSFDFMAEARSVIVRAKTRSQQQATPSMPSPRPDIWGWWACGAAGAWLAALACSAASEHLRGPGSRYELARVDGSHARVELCATAIWNPPAGVRLPLYTSRRSRAVKAAEEHASALVRLHESSLLVVNA